jgi:hypothetical protein
MSVTHSPGAPRSPIFGSVGSEGLRSTWSGAAAPPTAVTAAEVLEGGPLRCGGGLLGAVRDAQPRAGGPVGGQWMFQLVSVVALVVALAALGLALSARNRPMVPTSATGGASTTSMTPAQADHARWAEFVDQPVALLDRHFEVKSP